MEEHVGDSLTDREAATGLRANKGAFLEVELEKGMVELV